MSASHPDLEFLHSLIREWENECVEFKEANDNFPTSDIGKYFSALANEANLRNRSSAWLVFGVNNRTRETTGTIYRMDRDRLHSLKKQIADGTGAGTLREIHEVFDGEKRILLFEIMPAPRGLPVAWNGHCYARSHESLTALSDEKRDEIRSQTPAQDWSAAICEGASISDLDPAAILKAREAFTAKHSGRIEAETIAAWPDSDFLDRAGVTISGRITRTAILLLGKPESAHFISPYAAEMTWKLEGEERAYEHFHPPFILTSSLLYQRIRNIQLTLLRPGDLIAFEVPKYDQRIILEALHNCIAHQDYTRSEHIIVTEKPHELIFQNAGSFIDGTPRGLHHHQQNPHPIPQPLPRHGDGQPPDDRQNGLRYPRRHVPRPGQALPASPGIRNLRSRPRNPHAPGPVHRRELQQSPHGAPGSELR